MLVTHGHCLFWMRESGQRMPDPLAPLWKLVRVAMSLCASSEALQVPVQINWGAWYPRFAWNQNQAGHRLI